MPLEPGWLLPDVLVKSAIVTLWLTVCAVVIVGGWRWSRR